MAKRTTKQTKQTHDAASATAAGLQDLIDTAEELLEDVKDQSGEAVEALRGKVSATANSARERLAGLGPQIKDAASDALENAAAFARRDPWRAVALAALTYIALSV